MKLAAFLDSLRPIVMRGPLGRQEAIGQLDGALAAIKDTPNPDYGPVEMELLRQARDRIAKGKMP